MRGCSMGIKHEPPRSYRLNDLKKPGRLTDTALAELLELEGLRRRIKRTDLIVLDVGPGKKDVSSTAQHVVLSNVARDGAWHTLDINGRLEPTHTTDITKNTGIESGRYDLVFLLNVIEHLFDYRAALVESLRICRGILVVSVPFVYEYHTFPEDYWRMSPAALSAVLKDAGATRCMTKFIASNKATFGMATTSPKGWNSVLLSAEKP